MGDSWWGGSQQDKDNDDYAAGDKAGREGGAGEDFIEGFCDKNTPYGKGYQHGSEHRSSRAPDLFGGGGSSSGSSSSKSSGGSSGGLSGGSSYSGGGGSSYSRGGSKSSDEDFAPLFVVLALAGIVWITGLYKPINDYWNKQTEDYNKAIAQKQKENLEQRTKNNIWTVKKTTDDPKHPLIIMYTPTRENTKFLDVLDDKFKPVYGLENVRKETYRFEIGDTGTYYIRERNREGIGEEIRGPLDIYRICDTD